MKMKVINNIVALSLIVMVVSGCGQRVLKGNMKMIEVEKILGKPDRIETIPGAIKDNIETPTTIRWYYNRFPITTSGPEFGLPGHINFIPERFTAGNSSRSKNPDTLAHQYGEQSDTYRTFSFAGAFPTKDEYWHDIGLLDGLPLKEVPKKIRM